MSFFERLKFGKDGEDIVEKYLLYSGWYVVPIVARPDTGQKVYCYNDEEFACPDFLTFKSNNGTKWVEVKHKGSFNYYYKDKVWTVGIEKHYFDAYKKVQELSKIPVFIFFVIDKDEDNSFRMIYERLTFLGKNIHSQSSTAYFWNYKILKEVKDFEE